MFANNVAASTVPVRAFFAAFSTGNLDGILATFDPRAEITAVRQGRRADGQLHGTYHGEAGVRAFVTNLGATFETQAFSVEDVVGAGEVAFANGRFTHKVKATGKLFTSDWALRCQVRDGRIQAFQFYEDSAAFVEAAH